ncbi:MAG: nitroreductase family protein [Candidatus Thalassarchaeaceae archaeon]|jgi:nitroreductase|nr:nitroreductase family protein [Candidatus Thalassarchaeaceae archaeon]|tara:strand:- start:621 stop:1295 length:675 start_codon:yes stop_codon:yes gene_type:complete
MNDENSDFIDLEFSQISMEKMSENASRFFEMMKKRRTTRHFSEKQVPRELIEMAIKTAGTAPSGAHLQPWTFVAISNEDLKIKIRRAAEEEERKTYSERMPEAWAELLRPLGTDHIKEHITDAPWIVVVFRQSKRMRMNGEMGPTYYSQESCGIAIGLFIAAIQNMGLTTLTHTPSPMKFLRDILERPEHEHAMLLMPVGYPAEDAKVPNLTRKNLDEISEWFD